MEGFSNLKAQGQLYLLYVSGMRISEMVNLQVAQIQFDTNFITVSGKGGKGRVVPLLAPMMALFGAYVNETLPGLIGFYFAKASNFAKASSDRSLGRSKKNSYLFPIIYAQKIKPISRQAFWVILKELWAKTGSKKSISPHQLRHSLATHMLKKGVDLRSLQLLLGHENLSTVQIYTHLDVTYLRDVYDKKHPRA